jgi:hypothetical protein
MMEQRSGLSGGSADEQEAVFSFAVSATAVDVPCFSST